MTDDRLPSERCQSCAYLRREFGVRDGSISQERSVVLNRSGGVTTFIGDDREVVVRTGAARIDRQGAIQQIPRVGDSSLRALHQRKVDQRLDIPPIDAERDAKFGGGRAHLIGAHQCDAKVVVRLDVARIDRNRPLELLDRIVGLPAILIQQPEIVVDLGAFIVLLQQRPVVRQRIVVVADALVIQGETEMIFLR